MSRKQGRVHVVRVRKTHVDTQGGRREYVSVYLRRTYRDGTAVRNETVANLSMLPTEAVDAIEATLKGKRLIPAEEAFAITRSLPHGHVAAVAAMARKLGLPALLGPAGRKRDIALALIVSRVLRPGSKLSTLAWGPIPPSGWIWVWPARAPTRSMPRWTGWPTAKRRSSASSRPNTLPRT